MNAANKIPKSIYLYVTVLFLCTLVLRIVLTGYYNSNYGGIEQNVIYGIQRILSGQPLYQDPSAGTYAIMQYTPLWYYFAAGIARCIGIHTTDVQGIYMLCRVLALVFNLLMVITVALIIRSFRYGWLQSLVLAMPVLILLTSHYYTRGDSMHLFLFTASLYAYLRYYKTGGLKHILIAALFSAGCIMVKQSGILVIGIIGFCLLFISRRYLVAAFYCLCALLFAYLIAAACVHNHWQYFYQNAVLGLKNGTDLSFLYQIFTSQFYLDMVPCYVLGGVIVWLAVKKITNPAFRILAIGAAFSFLFAVTTGVKIGSSNNYFVEFLVLVIAATPYLLQQEEQFVLFEVGGKIVTAKRFAYIASLILITSKTIGFFSVVCIEKGIKNYKEEYDKEKALYNYVHNELHIARSARIFFTDRQFFDNLFMEQTIMPNKDVVMQVYACDNETFDYSAFAAGMNAGLVSYIITSEDKPDINEWHRYIPFIAFDKDRFGLVSVYSGYSIYAYSAMPR